MYVPSSRPQRDNVRAASSPSAERDQRGVSRHSFYGGGRQKRFAAGGLSNTIWFPDGRENMFKKYEPFSKLLLRSFSRADGHSRVRGRDNLKLTLRPKTAPGSPMTSLLFDGRRSLAFARTGRFKTNSSAENRARVADDEFVRQFSRGKSELCRPV